MTEIYQSVSQPDKDNPTTQNMRASYAQLLQEGHTLGPDDFHDAYHGAGFPEVPDLKTQLPSNQDLLDHSLEALRRSSMPISPETVHTTRKNVLDHWAATGQLPDINDGPTADAITRDRPYLSPVHQNISGVIRQIESGGLKDPDAAVSSAGAIGRYQIMPGTAKQYGFDPDRLHDPQYNTMVHNAIIDDLSRRYHGETDAILVAYNAGPEHADQYIANGRSFEGLGKWTEQTREYLKKADRLTYGDDLMKPGRDAVYDPMGTLGVKEEGPIAVGGLDLGAIAKAAGIPDLETQHQRVLEHVKQMEEEGASKAEQMTYQGLNDPYGNWFGVGSIGEVAGAALLKTFKTPTQQAEIKLSQGARDFVEGSIRAGTGEGRQIVAAASQALEEFRKSVNKGIPVFKTWLEAKPGTAIPFWENAPDIMHLIDHMEGGNGGGKLAPTSPLFPVAEAIRGVNQSLRKLIEQQTPDMQNFIEDYYRHLWIDPAKADQLMGAPGVANAGRQGSAASLQKRTVPTIADGIQAGLTPRILDPIENTLHYASGMTNYLMSERVRQEGEAAGYVKWFAPGKAPGGWEALEGRSATRAWQSGYTSESLEGTEAKIEELKDALAAKQERLTELQGGAEPMGPRPYGFSTGQIERAYAPAGYARSYNAWVGGGFYEWPVGGPLYAKLQQVANFMTGMKLSLSGFHALNILFENTASAISNATGEMLNGEVLRGFRDLGWGVTMIGPGITQAVKGARLQKAYLNLGAHPEMEPSTLDERLADLYAKVGGRAMGRGAEYGWNQAMNWGQAWERGALQYELAHNLDGTWGPGEETKAMRALMFTPRLAGMIGHEVGRVMSTITAPLFDKYIPRVKMAAWSDAMSTWMRANPMASEEAILKQGRYIHDSMDDRFGELVQDNLFWSRELKQTFNLATVSVGWEFGTVRAAYRAAKEIGNLNFRGEYARWAFSYIAAIGLATAAFQYLRTGQSVFQTGMPLPGTYYTGGQTVNRKPEIGLLPGIQKDIYQWYHLVQSAPDYTHLPHQIEEYAAGKLNPFTQMTTGYVENRDWKNDPVLSNIRNPQQFGLPSHWNQLGNYIMDAHVPLGIEAELKPGTAIPRVERLLGIRPAPEWMQDPQRIEDITRHLERGEARKERRQQRRQQQ
jgi:hypothetical protein